MIKKIPFILLLIIFIFNGCKDENSMIKTLKDQIVMFDYGFAGSSFDIYENNNKFIMRRTVFGSGVPVIGTVSYKVDRMNESVILFHEIYFSEINGFDFDGGEDFKLQFGKNNKIELIVNGKIFPETGRKSKHD